MTIALREPRWNAGRRAHPLARVRAAARKAAEVTEQRLTAFRFLFVRSFVARIERSEIRERRPSLSIVPGFRFAQSGLRVLKPDRDEAGHHHRLYLTKVGF